MAYFCNGTVLADWEAHNCKTCVHRPDDSEERLCPVMSAHWMYSYELCNEKEHPGKVILDTLIPQVGGSPGNCAMFAAKSA